MDSVGLKTYRQFIGNKLFQRMHFNGEKASLKWCVGTSQSGSGCDGSFSPLKIRFRDWHIIAINLNATFCFFAPSSQCKLRYSSSHSSQRSWRNPFLLFPLYFLTSAPFIFDASDPARIILPPDEHVSGGVDGVSLAGMTIGPHARSNHGGIRTSQALPSIMYWKSGPVAWTAAPHAEEKKKRKKVFWTAEEIKCCDCNMLVSILGVVWMWEED